MTNTLHAVEGRQANRKMASITSLHRSAPPAEQLLDEVKAVASALDQVRVLCSDVGFAALLAQVRAAPPERISAVLDELSRAAERAVTELREI